jgi:hypothetical protein
MKEIIGYKIVIGSQKIDKENPSHNWYPRMKIEMKVDELLNKGWQPYGIPIWVAEGTMYQTMVVYKED